MWVRSFEYDLWTTAIYSVPLVNLLWRSKKELDYAYLAAESKFQLKQTSDVACISLEELNKRRLIHVQRPYQMGLLIQTIFTIAIAIIFPCPPVPYLAAVLAVSYGLHMTQYSVGFYYSNGEEVAVGKTKWNGPINAFTI